MPGGGCQLAAAAVNAAVTPISRIAISPVWNPGRVGCGKAAVAERAPRVSLVLKADIRPGITGALEAKVEAVERYLAQD